MIYLFVLDDSLTSLGYLHSNHQFYVNILIRSRDLECTLVFLSAMPRSATVAIIYALRLLSLHL